MSEEISVKSIFEQSKESQEETPAVPVPKNKVRPIYYKDLIAHHKNRDINKEKVMETVESILINGLLTPPTVVLNDDGKTYTIVSGHHRTEAIIYIVEVLGKTEFSYIHCVVESFDELSAELAMYDGNLVVAPLSPYDKMIAIGRKEELLIQKRAQYRQDIKNGNEVNPANEIKGKLKYHIAKETSVESTQVGTYLAIYKKAIPEVKELLKKKKITLTEAYKYSQLSSDQQKRSLSLDSKPTVKNKKQVADKEIWITRSEQYFRELLQTKVTISKKKVMIDISGQEDLARIMDLLGVKEKA